jgi:uncharacterized protein YndB with AHSA1/START domain
MDTKPITVQTVIKAPISKVWDYWNKPEHIVNWAFASDDWETPAAENDLREGGTFKTVMAAKDKSARFDFTGVYTSIKQNSLIEYDMTDLSKPEDTGNSRRHVTVEFTQLPEGVQVVETFDPETENPTEMQKSGWQAILDNFKKYVESQI